MMNNSYSVLKGTSFFVLLMFLSAACLPTETPSQITVEVPTLITSQPIPTTPPLPSLPPTYTPIALTQTPSSTPTTEPTIEPTPNPSPTPTPEITELLPIPELVWLQRGSGTYDPPTILVVRNGIPAFEPAPMEIAYFWEYNRATGQLAYSTKYSQKCGKVVSDLWVYDYETGIATQWLNDNVFGASWSPIVTDDPETKGLLATAIMRDSCLWDLGFLSRPQNVSGIGANASPHFTWSNDGQTILFFRSPGGVFLYDFSTMQTRKVADLGSVGYLFDRPIFAKEQNRIFFHDNSSGLMSVEIDGWGAELPEGQVTYLMLWRLEKRQLIMGFQDPYQIRIYQLSEGFDTFIDETVIDGYVLADWMEPYETLLLVQGNSEAVIWSLDEGKIIVPNE